jgi:hypothetical protein
MERLNEKEAVYDCSDIDFCNVLSANAHLVVDPS